MTRNAQIRRQWTLWTRLASASRSLTVNELLAQLEDTSVTSRTIRRDLDVLRSVGVPIRMVRSGREVRYVAFTDGPELRLDDAAALALRMALGMMEPFRATAIGAALEQLERGLTRRMPATVQAHFAPLLESVTVRAVGMPDYGASEGVLATLRAALTESRTVRIRYTDFNGKTSKRTVHPQTLVHALRGLYLQAWDEEREMKMRTFRLERIHEAELLTDASKRDAAFDAAEELGGSIGIFSPEHAPTEFVFRVHSPTLARMLTENPLHTSQKLERRADGSQELRLTLTSSRELLSRVLAMGQDAEVLAPEGFRSEVAEMLHAALARYVDDSPEAGAAEAVDSSKSPGSRSPSVHRAG